MSDIFMKEDCLRVFKQSTSLSLVLIVAGVLFFLDSFHALGVLLGGLYCMFSIWTYERICFLFFKNEKQRKDILLFVVPLKLLVIIALVSVVLKSFLAPYLPYFMLGLFMFIPGSIAAALYAWKAPVNYSEEDVSTTVRK